ncbi:MAG TPA: alpha-ketoglutarate-dependent dioxygenase AlkB [Candidatus Limnocylindrales bacterium]|nr:alpha-ketoglutarate-dependent dioxygenase AlkB [Candidatus Limnocylindrales bacterium]
MKQAELFSVPPALPSGFHYQADFLSHAEEERLLATLATLPFREAQYKQFTARRRIVSFGGSYDFSSNELIPAGPVPEFLHPLRERIAEWSGIPAQELTHALIAEYQPGTQLGWHRDVPDFEKITGVSLAGACRMRLRPYPPEKGRRDLTIPLDLPPRSAYAMRGVARWGWQHAISPTKELRYSITFRTLAGERQRVA